MTAPEPVSGEAPDDARARVRGLEIDLAQEKTLCLGQWERANEAWARVRGLREALRRIRDEVDHVGKDSAFTACNEIARAALAATPTTPPRRDVMAALRAVLTPVVELAAKASPAPWKIAPRKANNTLEIFDDDGKETCSLYSDWKVSRKMRADASLIVALRNALPALLDLLAASADAEPSAAPPPPPRAGAETREDSMVEHNATCCPKLYAVLVAAEAFCEEVQEDHPAIDAQRLQALNDAIDTARGSRPGAGSPSAASRAPGAPGEAR